MAVLEVLPEVVRPEELLAAVALAELVRLLEVPDPLLPVRVRYVPWPRAPGPVAAASKVLAAVAARIRLARPVRTGVEGPVEHLKRRAAPAVPPDVQAVLVPLRLVLVLEPVAAVCALVLLLQLVRAVNSRQHIGTHTMEAAADWGFILPEILL